MFELEICDEFCWLCDISGYLISKHTIDSVLKILGRNEKHRKVECFIRVQLTLLRACRLLSDARWDEIYHDLQGKVKKSDVWNEPYTRMCYENALQKLYSFEWRMLEECIRIMPADKEHGEWQLRKAGLLACIGKYDETLDMLQESIEYVRQTLLNIKRGESVAYNRFSSLESSLVNLYNYTLQAYEAIYDRSSLQTDSAGDSMAEMKLPSS